MDIFIILLAGIVVPPMVVTAAISDFTDRVISLRNKIVKALGLEDFYYL